MVTSISGNASSNFSDVETGVKAYVNAINAKGGVNGHPLKYIMADDQSSPTQNLTAAKDLVENKKVVAIGSWGPFLFGSADYLNAKSDALKYMDKENSRGEGMKQFLDEKTYRPGLGHFKRKTAAK